MSEGSRSERASPTGTVGYAYRAGSRPSRIGADPVVGPGTVACDDAADGDRSRIGRLVPIRERTFRRGRTVRGSNVHRRIHDGAAFSLPVYPTRSEADSDRVTGDRVR